LRAKRTPSRRAARASSARLPVRVLRAESTRRRIMDAAREIFFRRGYEAASLDDVARLAGVAKGTLYVHFRNKAVLYLAVLTHNAGVFAHKMRLALSKSDRPDDQMRAIAQFYFSHYRENPQYFQIFWAMENDQILGSIPRKVVDEILAVFGESLAILEDVVRRGVESRAFRRVDPRETAVILWTMANGLLRLKARVAGKTLRDADLDRLGRDAIELFISGLTNLQFRSSATR
jgi:AcrR family transcriptional regulator